MQLAGAHGAAPVVAVVATHGLFVGDASARLDALGLARLLVSGSLAIPPDAPGGIEVWSLAPLLAEAIGRLVRGEQLDDFERFA